MFTINAIILISIIFVAAYYPRARCWFTSFKPQKRLCSSVQHKLALFIPARNEGKEIIPLLDSVSAQTYDRSNFDVFVVVKDPHDEVYEYAHAAGAEVFCDTEQTCKGDCLDFGFNKIIHKYPGKYDAFIIVDADCVLKSTFMEEMNNAMADGADVVNAKKLVRNYFEDNGRNSNIITQCNGLIWTFMDDMGNRWKSDHGYTTMTVTTGILISARLVEKWNGWIYKSTLTEDMEFQRDCSLQRYRTTYYSYAQLYMEEAPQLTETDKRRTRWMTGLTHSDFIYGRRLLARKDIHSIIDNYFMFCLWIVYAYIASMFVIALGNVGCCVYEIIRYGMFNWALLDVSAIAIGAVYGIFFLLTVASLVVAYNDMKLSLFRRIIVLFVHPFFYMQYITIVSHAIIDKRETSWDEIARVETADRTDK
jgi:cellulose synthase/poly-beta-1,6-N-acetylglucosamine synthase-like glycosyltransferase